uniref:Uncharacterized protein n=1 Tax=Anguilla anguilla TaxID=7936 RepID=A0A0E9UCV6_ANGAN
MKNTIYDLYIQYQMQTPLRAT